ncbi:MAG: MobQ family relaxase [Prochloraceae cyanobacterium]|nr:MobQ family relaxase [Prochloraceae cyanobacterium]
MAIYHFSAQIISRGGGKSATASAAYRAREKIYDQRTKQTFDYRYKGQADHCQILAPSNAKSWVYDRQLLWNKVEASEGRKDSQLAREINVALPVELSKDEKIQLGLSFVKNQYVSKGMVADVAFHDLDSHNPHFHVMLTTRQLEGEGFASTKEKAWRPDFAYRKAFTNLLVIERAAWQDYANAALEKAGRVERIDRRTLSAQGVDRLPQIHLGPQVVAMEKKGIRTATGDEYRRIDSVNAEIAKLQIKLDINRHQIQAEKELETLRIKKQTEELRKQREQERKRQLEEKKRRQLEQKIQKLIEEARQKSIQRAAELEAQFQAEVQAKALKNKQVADIINTANIAIDRHGDKLGKSPYIQTIFDSQNYRIRASNLLNEYDLTIGKTLVIKDRESKEILLKYNQYNSGKNQLISENISPECVEHFATLSARFEQGKRVKEFYKLTNDFFWKLGKVQKLEGSPSRWVAEGNKYKLVLDFEGFKITAKDGRGEIFNYPKGVRNPELMVTTCKFTESDLNNFKQASKEVNNMLLKIRQQEEQQRRQRRSRSRGFEL